MMRNWWHGTYLIQFVRLCHRVRAPSSRSIVAVRIDWNRIKEEFKIQFLASISSRGGQLVKLRVTKKCSTFPAILQWYNSFSLNPCPWNPDGNKSLPASNVCVQFILVSIRHLPRSKLPIDSFWAPHCCFIDMNVIKISASQLVCEQIAVNIAKFDPFLRDALCKSKPP